MNFSSVIFLFFFLPLALAVYISTPHKFRNLSLLLIGLIYYEWTEGKYIVLFVAYAALNFGFGLFFQRINRQRKTNGAGIPLVTVFMLSIAINVSVLLFFKYAGFIAGSFGAIFESLRQLPVAPYAPIGLSFLTFRALSYVIDVYRRDVEPEKNPLRFLTYMTLFPLTLAGPIVRYRDIADQFITREVGLDKFARGVRRFVIGLGKKVLVANTVAVVADQIFGLPSDELSVAVAWLGALCYTLQIYFDFSGYSDMAIGIGLMLGFEFPENFNYPYISRSVREFWRRWHITLSTWFRDYVYIPLGGNRVSQCRNYFNLLLVFALCGLWHGANWTFLIWGLWHGVFLSIERTGFGKSLDSGGRPFAQIYVLLIVMIGWVFFRSENIFQALGYLTAMSGFAPRPVGSVMDYLNLKVLVVLVAGIIGSIPVGQMASKALNRLGLRGETGFVMASADLAYIFMIMGLSVVALAGDNLPFIYGGF